MMQDQLGRQLASAASQAFEAKEVGQRVQTSKHAMFIILSRVKHICWTNCSEKYAFSDSESAKGLEGRGELKMEGGREGGWETGRGREGRSNCSCVGDNCSFHTQYAGAAHPVTSRPG